jgi:hypothetical protein
MTYRGRLEDYRWLAEQCRQAARTASTENERTELLSRAETFDFLADHPPHPEIHHNDVPRASSELNE